MVLMKNIGALPRFCFGKESGDSTRAALFWKAVLQKFVQKPIFFKAQTLER